MLRLMQKGFYFIYIERTYITLVYHNLNHLTKVIYLNMLFYKLEGKENIVDGHRKLISGLVWQLIQHYSSFGEVPPTGSENQAHQPSMKKKKESPKKKLMSWTKEKLPPELEVNNFTTDWNDGRALGALVEGIIPGTKYLLKTFYLITHHTLFLGKTSAGTQSYRHPHICGRMSA